MDALFGDALFGDDLLPRPRRELAPGAIWIPGFLTPSQQAWLVARFHEWAVGPVPPRSATIRGHEMSVKTVCLGWHWRPYAYSRDAVDVNGNDVLDMPDWMIRLGRSAIDAAYGEQTRTSAETLHLEGDYTPDTALVNFYDDAARMGMHQDRDERSRAPVVSLSIGDSCTFRFGNTETRTKPYEDIVLESGDLFVFGGPSRMAYHAVTAIHPGTAPAHCGLDSGRINITLRETGLEG